MPRVKKGTSRNTASQKFLSLISNYTPGSKLADPVPKSSFLERTQNPSTGDVFMIQANENHYMMGSLSRRKKKSKSRKRSSL